MPRNPHTGSQSSDSDGERDEATGRDLSPSAQSHTSTGLEWDPSADVGHQVPSNTPVHQPNRNNVTNNEALSSTMAGISPLQQMVMAINYGYDLRTDVKSSRSRRFPSSNEPNDGSDTSQQQEGQHNSRSNSDGSQLQDRQRSSKSNSEDSANSSYKTASETEDISKSHNVSTSLSNSWQTSGLTRSEIELRKKQRDSRSSHNGSSSVVWVEIDPLNDPDTSLSARNKLTATTTTSTTENNVDSTDHRSKNNGKNATSDKKSVGIQAKSKNKENVQCPDPNATRKHQKAKGTQYAIDPYCLPAYYTCSCSCNSQQYQHYHPQQFNGGNVCKNTNGAATISIGGAHTAECQQYCIPMQYQYSYGMSVQGTGAGSSLQSRSKGSTNTKKSSESTKGNVGEVPSSGSSTDITPTCILIDKLINESDSSLQNCGYAALEKHRSTLVRKMRKELHHLEQLNKMLIEKKRSGSSPSNSSSNDENRKDRHFRKPKPPASKPKSKPPPNHDTDSHDDGSLSDAEDNVSDKEDTIVKHTLKTKTTANEKTKMIRVKGRPQEEKKKPPVSFFIPFEALNLGNNNGIKDTKVTKPITKEKDAQRREDQKLKFNKANEQQQQKQQQKWKEQQRVDTGEDSDGYVIFENDNVQISLQQAFQEHCPNIMANVQERENILHRLRYEREARAEIKRDYFSTHNNCLSPNESLNNAFPPKEPRLMSIRKMKELTGKKLKKLPEYQEKLLKQRVDEDRRTYRIMSQVFSRKLRQCALKGDVNVLHTKSLIRR